MALAEKLVLLAKFALMEPAKSVAKQDLPIAPVFVSISNLTMVTVVSAEAVVPPAKYAPMVFAKYLVKRD